MGSGLNSNDPTVVSAFHAQLLRQGFVVLLIAAVVAVAWNLLRQAQLRRAISEGAAMANLADVHGTAEPVARRLLRISFGLLWVFDGVLQGQQSMPLGMAPQVIRPAAVASPNWAQHLVNDAATIWSYHPVAAAAAAVWIQIGIGVWLLVAPRGRWSRSAGIASVAWGAGVWVLAESFGQVFAPGLTLLFGAPGAVLFYCVAGGLVALPERLWSGPLVGRTLLRVIGVFFVGMALLQAWPGRGYWQGQVRAGAKPGTLTAMVRDMAQTPQPHFLSSWVSAFASFDAAHGWGVNLFVVVALFAIGTTFLYATPAVARIGLVASAVLCLADWILIEDLGFMGGVGTDPNSMIPLLVLLGAGYLAIVRVPESIGDLATTSSPDVARARWRERLLVDPTYVLRSVAALGAAGITLLGAAPFAFAAANPHADPILSQAIDGTPNSTDAPAPSFDLFDQFGHAVSLRSLRGKAVAITFLDPLCTSDCPIIAQEFRDADGLLGKDSRSVELVAVDANPTYVSTEYLDAFDREEDLDHIPNWRYLTGSLPQLESVWNSYGAQISLAPGGAMVAHSEFAYVIDPGGRTRYILDTDPGPGTQATKSSFSVTLAHALEGALHR
ncbi:MAG: SCO family protein [Acidimicrobiales bacterium]